VEVTDNGIFMLQKRVRIINTIFMGNIKGADVLYKIDMRTMLSQGKKITVEKLFWIHCRNRRDRSKPSGALRQIYISGIKKNSLSFYSNIYYNRFLKPKLFYLHEPRRAMVFFLWG
jgi:hypothetical protein